MVIMEKRKKKEKKKPFFRFVNVPITYVCIYVGNRVNIYFWGDARGRARFF